MMVIQWEEKFKELKKALHKMNIKYHLWALRIIFLLKIQQFIRIQRQFLLLSQVNRSKLNITHQHSQSYSILEQSNLKKEKVLITQVTMRIIKSCQKFKRLTQIKYTLKLAQNLNFTLIKICIVLMGYAFKKVPINMLTN